MKLKERRKLATILKIEQIMIDRKLESLTLKLIGNIDHHYPKSQERLMKLQTGIMRSHSQVLKMRIQDLLDGDK